MSEMVERVAKAIQDELGVDWPYAGHEFLLDAARAAIRAMREPTPAMVNAANEAYANDPAAVNGYGYMVEAALADQPTEEGKRRYPPDGKYEGNPCTCVKTRPVPCIGECGCEACHAAYGDFLSCE